MPSIFLAIKNKYPQFDFKVGDQYYWSPSSNTIFYKALADKPLEVDNVSLLHELSHALLGHAHYDKDIELLKMEREAWDKTVELASLYKVDILENDIEEALDSYRHWLHARSICPNCNAIGHEAANKIYKCIACGEKWKPNEARLCGLKRYKV